MEIRCAQLLCVWQIPESSALGGERCRGHRHRISAQRRKLVELETGWRRGAIWGTQFEENIRYIVWLVVHLL